MATPPSPLLRQLEEIQQNYEGRLAVSKTENRRLSEKIQELEQHPTPSKDIKATSWWPTIFKVGGALLTLVGEFAAGAYLGRNGRGTAPSARSTISTLFTPEGSISMCRGSPR